MFSVQDASTVFTLTDAASDKVKSLITAEGNPELVLRVAVRPGGCSGFSYEMFFDSDIAADDLASAFGDVKVVVDPKSLAYIDGTELDFVREGLNEGFRFNNPNVKDECGCGESFRV